MRKSTRLPDDFAVFILTNGRPNNIITLTTLKRSGYKGRLYIICDNEDKTLEEYKRIYGDKVIVFNKQEYFNKADNADLTGDKRVILYARNACFDIARKLGIRYFMELDDDYKEFLFRFNHRGEFITRKAGIKRMDNILAIMLKFYKTVPYCLTVAMCQAGDFIGGYENDIVKRRYLKRKAMNSFLCDTERPFNFMGRVNEDVNMYCTLGRQGKVILSVPQLYLVQTITQSQTGGMSEMYKDYGTYSKSFYTVMYCPSFVRIKMMGNKNMRLHHNIQWKYAVPKVLSEDVKKK